MKKLLLALLASLAMAAPAGAAEPATVSGHFTAKDIRVTELSHAIALRTDNAEGLPGRGEQMRVLLSKEELPFQWLLGADFPAVRALAKVGRAHGLLLQFDPAAPNEVQVTVLIEPPKNADGMLPSFSRSASGLWAELDMQPGRIAGKLKLNDGASYDLDIGFSAPVAANAVKQDLKGKAAQQSEPVRVLLARIEAMGRGDAATAKSLSTGIAAEQLATMAPGVMKQIAGQMTQAGMVRELKAAQRVIVREQSASVEASGDWFTLVRENNAWKVAD
jgi:hypothetical protein